MIKEEYIIQSVEYIDGGDDSVVEARAKYKGEFPGRSARRMTHLGMMIGLCLQKMDIRTDVPLIYASTYAESASFEKFIDSFPQASPALFQSSIHPSAVEQALIPGKQSIDRFYPITSNTNLAGRALENCFLLGEDTVILAGGEERGTWLCEHGMASDESFAYALELKRKGDGVGKITLDRSEPLDSEKSVSCPSFAKMISDRRSVRVPSIVLGVWIQIDWE